MGWWVGGLVGWLVAWWVNGWMGGLIGWWVGSYCCITRMVGWLAGLPSQCWDGWCSTGGMANRLFKKAVSLFWHARLGWYWRIFRFTIV